MGPEKKTIRPPLRRRGALLGAALIIGNVCLFASLDAAASGPQSVWASLIGQEEGGGGGPIPGWTRTFEIQGMLSSLSAAERSRTPAPEAVPFPWPASVVEPAGLGPLLPKTLESIEWTDLRAELVADVYRRCDHNPWIDVADLLLEGPEMLFNEILNCLGSLSGRSVPRDGEEAGDRSVTARMLDIRFGPRAQPIISEFMEQWIDRERKYLRGLQESRAEAAEFQELTEDEDLRELLVDQRKILWDALRRTYVARYKTQIDEQIPKGARILSNWTAVDFVVLPPLIGGYLYYRGISRKISMGQTSLRISVEPLAEILHRDQDFPVIAALEWRVKGFPVGVIVSVGLDDGRYGLDFVGIGTSIGAVRSVVNGRYEVDRP